MFSGIINLRKPSGVTSADCVSFVKRLLNGAKVGHGGTLDPFATGVLPIGVNAGTKILNSFLEGDKEYCGRFRFFVATDTLDCEGMVTELCSPGTVDFERIRNDADKFRGEYEQLPPAYSARRIKGKRLYDLARRNKEIPAVTPRLVQIKALKLSSYAADSMSFAVTCSKGTYIRQLIKDILAESGNIGVLEELVRHRVAGLNLENSISFLDLFGLVLNRKKLIGPSFYAL
jgi:tRNA pseudouridine55 synthase